MTIDDILPEDERLNLWCDLVTIAATIQEYTDLWWSLDEGLHRANERRAAAQANPTKPRQVQG
jgi:hypothetical protein